MKTLLFLCLFLLASCVATPTAPAGEVCPISGEPIDPTVPAVLMATVDGTVVKAPRFCPKHSKLTPAQQAAALAAKGK